MPSPWRDVGAPVAPPILRRVEPSGSGAGDHEESSKAGVAARPGRSRTVGTRATMAIVPVSQCGHRDRSTPVRACNGSPVVRVGRALWAETEAAPGTRWREDLGRGLRTQFLAWGMVVSAFTWIVRLASGTVR